MYPTNFSDAGFSSSTSLPVSVATPSSTATASTSTFTPLKDDVSTMHSFWRRAETSYWNTASRTNTVLCAGHSEMGSPAGTVLFTTMDTSFSTLRLDPQYARITPSFTRKVLALTAAGSFTKTVTRYASTVLVTERTVTQGGNTAISSTEATC